MRGAYSLHRLCLCAMLLAVALIIFTVEAQLPPPVPVPGVKLGLANLVTLTAFYLLGKKEAFGILVLRSFLSAVFSGTFSAVIYSLCGGVLSFFVMVLLVAVLKDKKIWLVSVSCGVAHNIGQLLAASLVLKSFAVWWYLLPLITSGAVAGFFVGLASAGVISTRHIKQLFAGVRQEGTEI